MVRNEVLNRANFDILEAATKTLFFLFDYFFGGQVFGNDFFPPQNEKTKGITRRKSIKKHVVNIGIKNYEPQLARFLNHQQGCQRHLKLQRLRCLVPVIAHFPSARRSLLGSPWWSYKLGPLGGSWESFPGFATQKINKGASLSSISFCFLFFVFFCSEPFRCYN